MKANKFLKDIFKSGCLGISIGYCISVLISSFMGSFSIATPILISKVGELRAAQMLVAYSFLIGASFKALSFIWKKENLSLWMATLIYFTLNFIVILFAGYKMCWFRKNEMSFLLYFAIYTVIFIIIWLIYYIIAKKNVRDLNESLKKQ